MKYIPTVFKGVFVIEPEPIEDERGFFERSFCQKEFQVHNINTNIAQCNISYNKSCGTIRGMHFQQIPNLLHHILEYLACL